MHRYAALLIFCGGALPACLAGTVRKPPGQGPFLAPGALQSAGAGWLGWLLAGVALGLVLAWAGRRCWLRRAAQGKGIWASGDLNRLHAALALVEEVLVGLKIRGKVVGLGAWAKRKAREKR
ncbi:MAG: hypothetical protein C4525_03885 [Desulfarculus sp.]|nr:MAG: hypothetical protein C4525_03885 [Desulfarculus sp.]